MKHYQTHLVVVSFCVGIFVFVVFGVPMIFHPVSYEAGGEMINRLADNAVATTVAAEPTPTNGITHVPVPSPVKGIYMSSWVAGTTDFRDRLIAIADTTEVNTIVIDIKDYTGQLAYQPSDSELAAVGSGTNRIADIKGLIKRLHEKNIYVIGRVAVFQDPFMVKKHPEWAVKRASDGAIWKDRKGITWIDANASGYWNYIAAIAKDAYENQGFDEINFDYIRFPSDGNMKDIAYPFAGNTPKHEALKKFYQYLHKELDGTGMKTSADLFGMVTTNRDDLGIGQILEDALPYFDYICPMVYPSHYPPGFNNYKNPAAVPYEVIKYTIDSAVTRAKAASTSPQKIRPWLQDFDLGADYTAPMVRAQIQATYDTGLTSWLMWDPNNKYTKGAFQAE